MLRGWTRVIVAMASTLLVTGFVLGLAHSISTGFAGFWGGFPFWIIALLVMSLAAYDCWDQALRPHFRKRG